MKPQDEALLPCPFCGTEMELIHDHTTENIDVIQHKTAQPYCPIDGSSAFGVGNENLVTAWNTRLSHSTPGDAEVRKALEEAYEKVKLFPEERGAPMQVGGSGFMDLLALRNLIPDVLKALATPSGRAQGEVVAYLVEHKANDDKDTAFQPLTDADKAAGWTETPLYAAPPAQDQKGVANNGHAD